MSDPATPSAVRGDPPSPDASPGARYRTAPHPALDWQRVAAAIAGEPIGYQFVYLPITESTNGVARNLAVAGAPEGVVVYADAQTAGRGRPGKPPWLTPSNASIAVSVILRPALSPAELPSVTLAAGVAAVDAIRETTGVPARLKWPNDVVVGQGKLGGILAESALAASAVAYVVLGIGLNCNFPAAALGELAGGAIPPATLQDGAGRPISREDLLIALLRRFGRLYAQLQDGQTAAVWQRYRGVLSTLGQRVRLLAEPRVPAPGGPAGPEGDPAPVEGRAEDVTPDGALVVRLASGERRAFTFGDVSLREVG